VEGSVEVAVEDGLDLFFSCSAQGKYVGAGYAFIFIAGFVA
jgi:hypothetical protein